MVEVGGKPMLWHIMKIYAAHGFNEFVVALGYRGESSRRYFLDYYYAAQRLDRRTGGRPRRGARRRQRGVAVHLVDTGLADRDRRAASSARGLARGRDVHAHVRRRRRRRGPPRWSSSTAPRQAGDGDGGAPAGALRRAALRRATASTSSREAADGEGWINGGFFVFEPEVLDYIDGDETMLEREPLERLAEEGQLDGLPPRGLLAVRWTRCATCGCSRGCGQSGEVPWKVWE